MKDATKSASVEVNDLVYLFQEDPKCETIYEVVDLHKDGRVVLYHPVKLQVEAYIDDIKPSIH